MDAARERLVGVRIADEAREVVDRLIQERRQVRDQILGEAAATKEINRKRAGILQCFKADSAGAKAANLVEVSRDSKIGKIDDSEGEFGAGEVCAGEARTGEVRTGEVRVAEVRVAEVGAPEVLVPAGAAVLWIAAYTSS